MTDTNLADRLASALRPLLRRFLLDETRTGAAGRRVRYNVSDFQTIAYLTDAGPARAGKIAEFLKVSPTTMQSIIDRLEAARIVVRMRDPDDRRASVVTLTDHGIELSRMIREQDRQNCAQMLEILDHEARAQLVESIEAIAHGIGSSSRKAE